MSRIKLDGMPGRSQQQVPVEDMKQSRLMKLAAVDVAQRVEMEWKWTSLVTKNLGESTTVSHFESARGHAPVQRGAPG